MILLTSSQADTDLDPIRTEIRQTEQKKSEYRQAIVTVKANVLQNDAEIQRMLVQAVEGG